MGRYCYIEANDLLSFFWAKKTQRPKKWAPSPFQSNFSKFLGIMTISKPQTRISPKPKYSSHHSASTFSLLEWKKLMHVSNYGSIIWKPNMWVGTSYGFYSGWKMNKQFLCCEFKIWFNSSKSSTVKAKVQITEPFSFFHVRLKNSLFYCILTEDIKMAFQQAESPYITRKKYMKHIQEEEINLFLLL